MSRAAIVLVLLASTGARADLLSHASVRYGDVSLTIEEQFGAGSATAQLLYTSPGQFHGVAEAAADYGVVRARANVLGIEVGHPINTAQGEARFSDILTISGGVGGGFVVYTYRTSGHAAGEESLGALFLEHGGETEELDDEIAGEEEFASEPHAFTFGQPFAHGVVLMSSALVGLGGSGEFECDLTAAMTGIEVFDSAMNPVAQFGVASASGTAYPVPAPAGLLTIALGLIPRRRRSV